MFYIGQKVVCIRDITFDINDFRMGVIDPHKGQILTIRTKDDDGLRFEEIVNPKLYYSDGYGEVGYDIISFRPILTDSIEYAEKLLEEITIEINEENLVTK